MGEKIRIAYILPTEVRGGVEEHVLSLVKGIDRTRFQTFIVAPPKLLESLRQDLESDETVEMPLRISSLRDWRSMASFYRFLKTNRIHLVNTHMFIATFYYAPIARFAGVPVLLETTHLMEKWRLGKGFLRRNSFVIDRFFYLLLDKVLAVSHACKRDLAAMKRVPLDKIAVVHNGRDLASFDPDRIDCRAELRREFGYAPEDFVFGVFARLNHQKGHGYLVEAVGQLKNIGIRANVLCVGNGELQEDLAGQCREAGIADRIVFAGFRKNIPALLSMVDATVLPSLYEGLPLCVIESLAMGKPVIATAVDGTPEIVVPDQTGLLVPARDPYALAEAMRYALENRDGMRTLGERGRRYVRENFSLQRQVRETEGLYENLCARKGVLL